MAACLQTTPLTDTHTKEPVNGTEAHARPHVHVRPQKRTEQCVVTRKADA